MRVHLNDSKIWLFSFRLKQKVIVGVLILLSLALINKFWIQESNHAVVLSGGCEPMQNPLLVDVRNQQPFGKNYRVTSCSGEDSAQFSIFTDYFTAGADLKFIYSGYPANEGVDLYLERQDGLRFELPLDNTGAQWQEYDLTVPEAFRDGPVRMIIQDVSTEPDTWAGIGEVGPTWHIHINLEALLLFIITLACMHLLLVLWLAVALKRFPGESGPAWFLIGLGIAGYLAFWAYYLDRWAGLSLSAIALLSAIGAVVWAWRNQCWRYIRTSNYLVLPVSLYTLFILIVCYFPDFNVGDLAYPGHRFVSLPTDNFIPKLFAEAIWSDQESKSSFGDWHWSDRPPLQTGIYLVFYVLENNGIIYQIVSSELQSLVFIPLFMLVRRMNTKLTPLAAIALGITSLMAVHVLFVWPKLIASTYSLIFFMLALTTFGDGLPRRVLVFLLGASVALAMLSHGGAVFGIMAITLLYLLRNKFSALLNGLSAFLVTVLIYAPWVLYQRWIDPPGDKLIKLHLAGMEGLNQLTISEAIVSAYNGISIEKWLDGRLANLKMIFAGSYDFSHDYFITIISPINNVLTEESHAFVYRSFFETFYSLWWFSPIIATAVWVLCRGHRNTYSPDLIWLIVSAFLSAIISIVLMFTSASASIHQSSFYMWIAFYISSVVLVGSVSPAILRILLIMNAAAFFHFYIYDVVWNNPVDVGIGYLLLTAIPFYYFVKSCMSLKNIDDNYRVLLVQKEIV